MEEVEKRGRKVEREEEKGETRREKVEEKEGEGEGILLVKLNILSLKCISQVKVNIM